MNFCSHFLKGCAFLGIERLDRVIASFCVQPRAYGANHFGDTQRVEDDHVINGPQRGEHSGTIALGIDGTGRSLQLPHRLIGIDRYCQGIPEGASAREVIDMSCVKEIEATIGQHKAPTGGPEPIGLAGKLREG